MVRADLGGQRVAVLTAEQISFLQGRRVGYLATVDTNGRPHVVPVCYAYHQGCIYTPIDTKPKRVRPLSLQRIRNILARPDVCLVVDAYEEDWSRLAWLQVRGSAAVATDPVERAEAITILRARYPQYGTMPLETRPLIRIRVQAVIAWAATRQRPDG